MLNLTPYAALIDAKVALAKEIDPSLCFDNVAFIMNSRFQTCAGRARNLMGRYRIDLNAELFGRLSDEDRAKTIAHELAHVLCWMRGYQNEHHGEKWKCLAILLGDDGKRGHNHEVKHNKVKRVVLLNIEKPDKVFCVSSTYHRRMPSQCKLGLEFVGVIQLDKDNRTYKWEKLTNNNWLDKPLPLMVKVGYKRVA
jgi:hypothetical protein